MTKAQQAERDEAIGKLREWIKPGDTVYTILDHVSSSGMSRAIRTVLLNCENGKADATHPNYAVGKALGLRHWKWQGHEQDALVLSGCGMDMGFHLVYELSYLLYGGKGCPALDCDARKPKPDCATCHGTGQVNGYKCLGKGRCPSNYHPNPIEGPERFDLIHTDGYALRHRWL